MLTFWKCTTLFMSLSKSISKLRCRNHSHLLRKSSPSISLPLSLSPSALMLSSTRHVAATETSTEKPLFSRKHSNMSQISPALLAQAWTKEILKWADDTKDKSALDKSSSFELIRKAIERTLPLLGTNGDGSLSGGGADAVPFVCRYRSDIIAPLSTKQVHQLQKLLTQHTGLATLRSKVLKALPSEDPPPFQVLTTTSKSVLEDWYAPYKPPSKGSILQRIQTEHPQLVKAVDDLWSNKGALDEDPIRHIFSLGPKESLIHLLGSKIAADPHIISVVNEELEKHCRIHTKVVKVSKKDKTGETVKTNASKKNDSNSMNSAGEKYTHYDDYHRHLMQLKDHQVLAIRRGVNQKQLSLSYDIDGTKMESCIAYHLRKHEIAPTVLYKQHRDLYNEAVHDAWTRLLRQKGTSRIWTSKCQHAQERAYQVFQDNLRRALLAPPLDLKKEKVASSVHYASNLVALDPGYSAGVKCAILNFQGTPQHLDTVHFLGSRRQHGMDKLVDLLIEACDGHKDKNTTVLIALGNGHGSQECRSLIQEASDASKIPVDIHLVNEAGASVWSVTEMAKREFPDESPAGIASISIGRRLLNPLFELVKVPPRSLGLGMYQHDLAEKELDDRLHVGSVDAVATVGVDVNSCSLEIMEKVPGIQKLASKIIAARPLAQRTDLLNIPRLGPKAFENSAAFLRIDSATVEPLDATLVHPESYHLARWLLKELSWKLDETIPEIPPRLRWGQEWKSTIAKASMKFHISEGRVLAVLSNLVDSINRVDPRMDEFEESTLADDPCLASTKDCKALPPTLVESNNLKSSVPVRGVVGVIRNVSDFGAFIDFGGHNDGLLHKSKLGPKLRLENLLIGQSIGVDILDVKDKKVSLGLHGLRLEATKKSTEPASRKRKR